MRIFRSNEKGQACLGHKTLQAEQATVLAPGMVPGTRRKVSKIGELRKGMWANAMDQYVCFVIWSLAYLVTGSDIFRVQHFQK